jgi:hypothetical protein
MRRFGHRGAASAARIAADDAMCTKEESMRPEITIRLTFVAMLCLGVGIGVAAAQKKPVQKSESVSETATIDAIDHTNRIVTLKTSDGELEDIYAGPEVKRFDQLKVGDKVTFTYRESMVFQVRKAGTASTLSRGGEAITRSAGEKPGATLSQQKTATVTVEAVDMNVPSITVRTAKGHKISAKIEDKKDLEGVKVGDKVDITYTEALMVTVESPKK